MNPQIRFGEDLMSRVSYVMLHPDGVGEMTAAVRQAIDRLARETAAEAGVDVHDLIEVVLVGNPIMHHLLLGIDPTELGTAPFTLATDGAVTVYARDDLGLDIARGSRPHRRDDMSLIVDVGTNAEIVLGNRDRLLAASSPTGPAFEGAQISCGQRAAPGAVERVRIDPETLEPRIKVIGCDLWSDEAGFAEAVASTGVTGICGSGIIEAIAEMFLAGIVTRDGVIDGSRAADSPRIGADGRTFAYRLWDGPPVLAVTQNDIRAIQLAKAALYAGARLLMDRMGVETLDRIVLAGAFGSHIDVKYAMVLGLIPDCDLEHVRGAGNAAGSGARIALLNREARAEIEDLVRRVEKVETAVEPAFQDHFIQAMAIPHGSDPFPRLASAVDLPAPRPKGDQADQGPRRRRRRVTAT
jgi:uncharacterized 2Fe-2S/4Fe-4S cluster protein (DUF4445 family)